MTKDTTNIPLAHVKYTRKDAIKKVLRDKFDLSDTQANEVLGIIECDNSAQENSLENYLLKDIVASNNSKKVGYEALKEALTNYKKDCFKAATEVKKWTYSDGQEKDLKYDTSLFRMTFEEGLQAIKRKDKQPVHTETICHSPVAITKRLQNADDNKVYFEVEFYDRSRIIKHTLSQKDLLSAKGAHDLCTYGLNIPDKRCSLLVDFFSEMLKLNEKNIPRENVYSTWGWKHKNTAFFIGKTLYSLDNAGYIRKEVASIVGVDESQINALVPHGTKENWFKSTKLILGYDAVRFAVYASCASILLAPLNQASRMINSWGLSGIGKTKKGATAVSMFGYSEDKDGGLTLPMNATETAFENTAALYNGIPLNLDDAQNNDDKTLTNKIYAYGNSQGKGRGKKDGGNRKLQTWSGLCFTSSEKPIHNESSLEGQMVRGYDFHEGIGLEKTPEALEAVALFESYTKTDYGVIAPILIEKILKLKSTGELQKSYNEEKEKLKVAYLSKNAEANIGNIGRVLDSFAVFAVGAKLFEGIMKENNPEGTKDYVPIIVERMTVILNSINQQSYLMRMLTSVYSWVDVNFKNFQINGNWAQGIVPNYIYGKYDFTTHEMYLNKDSLEEYLRRKNFDIVRLITGLQEEDCLKVITEKGYKYKLNDKKSRAVVVNTVLVKEKFGLTNPFENAANVDNSERPLPTIEPPAKIFNDEGHRNICDDSSLVITSEEAKQINEHNNEKLRQLVEIEKSIENQV